MSLKLQAASLSPQPIVLSEKNKQVLVVNSHWYQTCYRVIQTACAFFQHVIERSTKSLNEMKVSLLGSISSCIVQARLVYTKENIKAEYDYLRQRIEDYKRFYPDLAFTQKELSLRDGATIDGIEISQKSLQERTIVYLLPNCGLWSGALQKLSELAKTTHANIVCYNWRAIVRREDPISNGYDLIGDTIEVIESLKKAPRHKIILHGHSLGGAVAACVAHHFQQKGEPLTGLVSDRSFRSLQKTIRALFPVGINWIASFVTWVVGWRLDAEEALAKLKCRSLVMFHPHDSIIKEGARLVESAKNLEAPNICYMNMDHYKDTFYFDPEQSDINLKKKVLGSIDNQIEDRDAHNIPWNTREMEAYKGFIDKAFTL